MLYKITVFIFVLLIAPNFLCAADEVNKPVKKKEIPSWEVILNELEVIAKELERRQKERKQDAKNKDNN